MHYVLTYTEQVHTLTSTFWGNVPDACYLTVHVPEVTTRWGHYNTSPEGSKTDISIATLCHQWPTDQQLGELYFRLVLRKRKKTDATRQFYIEKLEVYPPMTYISPKENFIPRLKRSTPALPHLSEAPYIRQLINHCATDLSLLIPVPPCAHTWVVPTHITSAA